MIMVVKAYIYYPVHPESSIGSFAFGLGGD